MDEIEMVSSLRADPVPTTEVVAHHKDQLRTAIAAPSNGSAGVAQRGGADIVHDEAVFDLTLRRPVEGGRRRRRSRILVTAAVAAAVVGVAASVTANGGSEVESGEASPSAPDAGCGAELPFTFTPAEGFGGPGDGPLPGDTFALATPLDGQVVRHWTSPTAGVELRWPSQDIVADEAPTIDGTTTTVAGDFPPPDGATEISVTSDELPEGADIGFYNIDVLDRAEPGAGPAGFSGVLAAPGLGDGDCGSLRLTVTGSSPEAASDLFTASRASLLANITD